MQRKSILFLHGFASSSQGIKGRFLRDRFAAVAQVDFHGLDFNPTPRDFEYTTITGMINRLRQVVLERDLKDVRLVGSSLGSLVGLHYAHRFGEVVKMLLLAPVLRYPVGEWNGEQYRRWQEAGTAPTFHHAFETDVPLRYDFHADGLRYQTPIPPPVPTVIVHGQEDEVVPIAGSREYADAFPDRVELIEVDSDHRLNDQLSLIWERARGFLLS
ncbi:MAG TPA: alpha/beta fold hydrolase [Chloroflexi bacterium]|nr:alpha/beta fold hydrolase [Chloroflexota bacterium]